MPKGNPNPVPPRSPNKWKPGQSGNPAGRPKGHMVGLAKMAREIVGEDGKPLVEFHWALLTVDAKELKRWDISREDVTLRDRRDCADWLACRGWGKAPDVQVQEGDDPLGLVDAKDRLVGKLAPVASLDDHRAEGGGTS